MTCSRYHIYDTSLSTIYNIFEFVDSPKNVNKFQNGETFRACLVSLYLLTPISVQLYTGLVLILNGTSKCNSHIFPLCSSIFCIVVIIPSTIFIIIFFPSEISPLFHVRVGCCAFLGCGVLEGWVAFLCFHVPRLPNPLRC